MIYKFGILFAGIWFTLGLSAQKTTFYKDEKLWKETSEKRAKFVKTENTHNDTLVIQVRKISNDQLIAESRWLGAPYKGDAVGTWVNYDQEGNLVLERDFDVLVYSEDPIDGVYDNREKNPDCLNCEPALYPTGELGLLKFLKSNVRYPNESRDLGNSGEVLIRVIIDEEGNAIPHAIIQAVDAFIDLETWKLIKKMPKWNPATQNGEAIESFRTIIVKFVIL